MARQTSPIVNNASSRPGLFDNSGFFFGSLDLCGGASLAAAAFDAADSFIAVTRRDLRFMLESRRRRSKHNSNSSEPGSKYC